MSNDTDHHSEPYDKVVCLLPVSGPNEIYGYIGITVVGLLALYAIIITIWLCLGRKKLGRGKTETTNQVSELTRLLKESDSRKGSDSKKSSRTDKEENKSKKKKKVEKKQLRVSKSRNVRSETVDDVRSTWGPVQPDVM